MPFVPPWQSLVETKTCPISGEEFFITDWDINFLDQISPVFNGQKKQLPVSKYAPTTRAQARVAFRNERSFYHTTCDLSGRSMLSMYAPDSGHTVYHEQAWKSDDWSAYDYGRDFDFSQTFSSQFHQLWRDVPLPNLYFSGIGFENSDYTNWFGGKNGARNCYLCFNWGGLQECMYCRGLVNSQDCYDMYFGIQNEQCYQCTNCKECYRLLYSQDCTNCRDSYFLKSCIGCRDCFGCINLQGAQYCMFNEQLTPDVYMARLQELRLTPQSIGMVQKRVSDFLMTHPHRATRNINCENCIGDYMLDCRDVWWSFEAQGSESGKYLDSTKTCTNCMDCFGFWFESDHLYQTVGAGYGSNVLFSVSSDGCSDSVYSTWCASSRHIFASIGIKHGERVMFNRVYGQAEYEDQCSRIIDHMMSTGEWWEFFDPSISAFGYNETVGHDTYPLDHSEISRRGWHWRQEGWAISRHDDGYSILDTHEYDESIVDKEQAQKNISDCLNSAIVCSVTGRSFKIQSRELAFYIENGIPLPTIHPNERFRARAQAINPRYLWERECSLSWEKIWSTYAPDRPEKILSEESYRSTIY